MRTLVLILFCLLPAMAQSAVLGVRVVEADAGVRVHFADVLPENQGLVICYVAPGTPAAEFLLPGDILLRAGGTELRKPADLACLVQQMQAGDVLHLELVRLGVLLTVKFSLGGRPCQPVLNAEQQSALNQLLLLLVPPGDVDVDVPAVRRQMLELADAGLASRDEYATCVLYLRQENYLLCIKSTERILSVSSNTPHVPDVVLRADFYQRDAARLPESLAQLLLQAEYYRP